MEAKIQSMSEKCSYIIFFSSGCGRLVSNPNYSPSMVGVFRMYAYSTNVFKMCCSIIITQVKEKQNISKCGTVSWGVMFTTVMSFTF